MKEQFYEELTRILPPEQVQKEEPMKEHTTFRIGGPADWFLTPRSAKEIKELTALGKKWGTDVYIIGNGSNLLVGDRGIRGMVIKLGRDFGSIERNGISIYAQAGASMSKVAACALEGGLCGFEFAAGIPGTIGGAVVMNAGAYGGEMKDILESADILTKSGEVKTVPVKELGLAYRTSRVPSEGWIVLGASIRLQKGEKADIKARMDEYALARRTKQPLEYPSAGSTFKRPEGYFAGRLIEGSGLRGVRIGDAAVSDKHCGFLVNMGSATARQMLSLIEHVQKKVYEDSGSAQIRLKTEVKMIGDFGTEGGGHEVCNCFRDVGGRQEHRP